MGHCEPQSPMNGRGRKVTVCPRTALGRFKHSWCLQPTSSKELAAVRPQSRSRVVSSFMAWQAEIKSPRAPRQARRHRQGAKPAARWMTSALRPLAGGQPPLAGLAGRARTSPGS